MPTRYPELFEALSRPFAKDEVRHRPQGTRQIAYVTARAVMRRLDEVAGPENWWDEYLPMEHSVLCKLTLRLPDGEMLTKCDAGGYAVMPDHGDDDKSGYSDSFKRAAVKFGIGRYLYGEGVPHFGRAADPTAETRPSTGDPLRDYQAWLREFVDHVNAEWVRSLIEATGNVRATGELLTTWQFGGHLLKWARRRGLVEAPASIQPGERDGYMAPVWAEHSEAIVQEARAYAWKVWQDHKSGLVPQEPGSDG